MCDKYDIWTYALVIFELPNIPKDDAARIIGYANATALLQSLNYRTDLVKEGMDAIDSVIKKRHKKGMNSWHRDKEILARKEEFIVEGRNIVELEKRLRYLQGDAYEDKVVLPDFRGVKHFDVGDEIVFYVDSKEKHHGKISDFNWISGKILEPGWDWVMHCISNVQWTKDGSNGGHYCRITDQNKVFKRSDFFKLRQILQEAKDVEFINLIPEHVQKNILEDPIDPLTDNEIKQNQAAYIKKFKEVTDFFGQNVPVIAERYGVDLDKVALQ